MRIQQDAKRMATPSPLHQAVAANRGALINAAAFTAAINVLMLVPPLYMLQLYDRVLVSASVPTLVALTLVLVFLLTLMAALEWVRSALMVRVGNTISVRLFPELFRLAYEHTRAQPQANRLQVFSDLGNVQRAITGGPLFALFDSPWTLVFLLILALVHWSFAVIAVVGALGLIGLTWLSERSTRTALLAANAANAEHLRQFDSLLRNGEVLGAMGMAAVARDRWLHTALGTLKHQSSASDAAAALSSASRNLRLLIQNLTLGMGAWLALEHVVSAGVMIAASIIVGRVLAPVEHLIRDWHSIVLGREAWRRLEAMFKTFPPQASLMPLPAPAGWLRCEGVSVRPPGSEELVLRSVSCEFRPGEMVAVIGPSGAGKTSLARVLVGAWQPLAGVVRLDQADLSAWDETHRGQHIGYLPQDVELFEATVSQNIARLGVVDPEVVVRAARQAGADEMIRRLPLAYDTPIGEGGAALSAGQRQRIALARALYAEPRVVILDEPNANLDKDGEEALLFALRAQKARGATVILIAHRPSLLEDADRILVLNEGQVAAFGSKEEVLPRFTGGRAVGPLRSVP